MLCCYCLVCVLCVFGQEHECQLTQDIVELIDREVDLMARRFTADNLEGLRRRICTLFVQFIKIPEFNPEVAKVLKVCTEFWSWSWSDAKTFEDTKYSPNLSQVSRSPSQLKNDFCRGCHRYLRSTDSDMSATGRRKSSWCRDCARLDNIGRTRDDFSCYKNILKRLRAEELQLNKEAKIPFLLQVDTPSHMLDPLAVGACVSVCVTSTSFQVEDMKYLVSEIWASRSALSRDSDLDNLVFLRWDRLRDWSPWNCILLSKQETLTHLEVEDVHKVCLS